MPISFDKVFGVHEAAMRIRAQRTELLASNLVNAETPNFKAKDIDFQAVMKDALAGKSSGSLKITNKGHIAGTNARSIEGHVKFRIPTQPSMDGNTVESHVEQAAFAKSAVEYQATLRFFEGKSKTIMEALKGDF